MSESIKREIRECIEAGWTKKRTVDYLFEEFGIYSHFAEKLFDEVKSENSQPKQED